MARLRDLYKNEVAPALMKKYEYKSCMQIPKIDKVVVNVGAGDAKDNSKVIDSIINDLQLITGQRPIATYAKKSVANFKLRQGMKIGVKVTLRGDRMYEFMDRLFNVALPRVRDFRGINGNSFDGSSSRMSGGGSHMGGGSGAGRGGHMGGNRGGSMSRSEGMGDMSRSGGGMSRSGRR